MKSVKRLFVFSIFLVFAQVSMAQETVLDMEVLSLGNLIRFDNELYRVERVSFGNPTESEPVFQVGSNPPASIRLLKRWVGVVLSPENNLNIRRPIHCFQVGIYQLGRGYQYDLVLSCQKNSVKSAS